jgi:hypothetical protein
MLRVGYDPSNGARPLRRLVERVLVTQLSKMVVGGGLPVGARVEVRFERRDGKEAFVYDVVGQKGQPAASVVQLLEGLVSGEADDEEAPARAEL